MVLFENIDRWSAGENLTAFAHSSGSEQKCSGDNASWYGLDADLKMQAFALYEKPKPCACR